MSKKKQFKMIWTKAANRKQRNKKDNNKSQDNHIQVQILNTLLANNSKKS